MKTLSAFNDGSVDALLRKIDEEIIVKLLSASTQSVHNESKQQKERPVEGRVDPLRMEDPRQQPFHGYPHFYEERRFPPPVGGADLGVFRIVIIVIIVL